MPTNTSKQNDETYNMNKSKRQSLHQKTVVNQINAQIKIQEIWKAININDYPLSIQKHSVQESMISTRAITSGKLMESGKTCKNDALKLWNMVPKHVQSCKSLNEIKTHAKFFAKSLPI